MFYRAISMPAMLEVGDVDINDLDNILKKNHLYFKNKILITQRFLFELFQKEIDESIFSEIIFVQGGCFEEIRDIQIKLVTSDSLLIAFGGGSVLDLVKMFAENKNMPYITIPSTLSNDAIFSPIARLSKRGVKKSFGVKSPIGIIVDTKFLKHSPEDLILAGVGDLISNLGAVKDCKLAIKTIDEKIDKLSLTLSQLGADAIMTHKKKDLKTDAFLVELANGLLVSGMSMVMANSSRPASGAEHLISHAIDEHYPEKSTLHGIQVAWAHLLIEKLVRNDKIEFQRLEKFYKQIGLFEVIDNKIKFSEKEFLDLIPIAIKMRKRFTILDVYMKDKFVKEKCLKI